MQKNFRNKMQKSRSSINEHNHLHRDLSQLPEYAQKYPSLVKYHLCDVKRSVCYPNPPTLRNIDRDEALHKLSDEHCRNTTYCGPECFDAVSGKYEDTKNVKRDFCMDKLLEKYSLDPVLLRNKQFEILKVCPSERKQFEQMCSHHKGWSPCIRYDPSLMRKEQEMVPCTSCYFNAPWN